MYNLNGQLAGQKALKISDFNSNNAVNLSTYIFNKEVSLFVHPINYSNYRYSKIIKYALTKYDLNDDNLIGESLHLFWKAKISYESKKEKVNFYAYSINFIKGGIKNYKSKLTGTNSSDFNEKIHTAIRNIKKKNIDENLREEDVTKLIKHFNLDKDNGYQKIRELESYQKKNVPIINHNNKLNEEFVITDYIKSSLFKYSADTSENIIEKKQLLEKLKKAANDFKKDLNHNSKIVFNYRVLPFADEQVKLENLSNKLSLSSQRIHSLEKKITEDFIIFLKKIFRISEKKN